MKIQTKIYLVFISIFVLVAVTSALILSDLLRIRQSVEQLNEVDLRLSRLADDIRYYDVVLTDAVRAYLIDPEDQAVVDRYFETADALDLALAEARELSSSAEARQLFENIDIANVDLIAIEEALLADPSLEQAVPLYRGRYGELKTDYSSNVDAFFQIQRETLTSRETETLEQVSRSLGIGVVAVIVLLVGSSVAAFVLSRNVIRPLSALVDVTRDISAGNWDTPLPAASNDEIGVLAHSFGEMVQQIRATLSDIESRARDMQIVVDVNNQVSTILETERLLQDVVDLTKERFRLYHAHVYLYDAAMNMLTLTAGAGHVGRQMVSENRTIEFDNRQSIVAEAARSRRGVIIQNVIDSPTFLPHPLLPETHSELAVPLIARGQVLGVLDVQSDEVGYFDDEVLGVMTLMAGQIATALSNARLFETTERISRHEQALGNIERHIQNATDIDDLLKTAVRELGKALRVPHTAIELNVISEEISQTIQPARVDHVVE